MALKSLSQGIKISISLSVTTTFEKYMEKIAWSEDKFNMVDFMSEWKDYITTQSSWYAQLDDSVKNDPEFHRELAVKINDIITKTLNESPTKEQIDIIDGHAKITGEDYDYSCKMEAKYVINLIEKSSILH